MLVLGGLWKESGTWGWKKHPECSLDPSFCQPWEEFHSPSRRNRLSARASLVFSTPQATFQLLWYVMFLWTSGLLCSNFNCFKRSSLTPTQSHLTKSYSFSISAKDYHSTITGANPFIMLAWWNNMMQLFDVASPSRLRVLEDEVCLAHSVSLWQTPRDTHQPGFTFLPYSPKSGTALVMFEGPCLLALVFCPSVHTVGRRGGVWSRVQHNPQGRHIAPWVQRKPSVPMFIFCHLLY